MFFRYEKIMKLLLLALSLILFRDNHLSTSKSSFSSSALIIRVFEWSKEHVRVLSSANRVNLKNFEHSGKSLMKIRNKRGPNVDPCGTPYAIFSSDDTTLLVTTCCFLFCKYEKNSLWLNL